jgi:putative ABC transport system permease protein
MFGARQLAGRLLVAEDFRTQDAVVISAGLWERAFGGESVLGRTITLDGVPRVVVGVMDRGFTPPEAMTGASVDVWRPMNWQDERLATPTFHVLQVAGRVAEGATLAQVYEAVTAMVARLAEEHPQGSFRMRDGTLRTLPVVDLQEATVGGEVRQGLGLLLGAVVLLLLVACTNVAHLFMARGISRMREMGVRRALGARTGALAGQLLAESLLIGAAGALLGIVLAHAGVAGLLALSPETIPRASAVRIDVRVLAFAAGVGALTALVFGMLPALRLVGRDVAGTLGGRGRGNSDTRRDRRLRSTLVIAEVALSLVLVVQAGALLRGFAALNAEELGFRTDGVWTMPLEPRNLADPSDWSRRMDRVRESVAAVPGVRTATYAMTMPLQWTGGSRCCWNTTPAFPGTEADLTGTRVDMHVVDADYFAVLDMQLVAGRAWARGEETMEPPPAVITEPLAIRVFGSAARAVGRELRTSTREDARSFTIIGVVTASRHYGPDQDHDAAIYMPTPTIPFPLDLAHVAVLVGPSTAGLADRLRDAVWAVEPELPIPTLRTLEEWAGEATARVRFEAALFSGFGSDVEADVEDVAVADDEVLALDLQPAGVLHCLFGAVLHEHVVRRDLGADEAALEVGVDAAGGLPCAGAAADGPGADLVGPTVKNEIRSSRPYAVRMNRFSAGSARPRSSRNAAWSSGSRAAISASTLADSTRPAASMLGSMRSASSGGSGSAARLLTHVQRTSSGRSVSRP